MTSQNAKVASATVLVNAIALWVAAWIVPGIQLGSTGHDTWRKILAIVLVAAIFGVLNAFVKPILQIVSVPLIVLTLGLFMVVVNACMLGLLSWLSGKFNLPFHVDKFWWDAIWGAVIVTLVGMVVNALLPKGWEPKR